MHGFLTENTKLVKLADPTGAGTTDVESAVLDMAGWRGVLLFTSFGTAAADNLIKAQSGEESDGSDMADVVSGAVAPGSSDEDQWVDVLEVPGRYARLVAQRGTSSTLGDIWALLYRGRRGGQTNATAGTIAGLRLAQPDAGEAEEESSSSAAPEEESSSSPSGE